MSEFKVGDRVINVGAIGETNYSGYIGTVIEGKSTDYNRVWIKWDEHFKPLESMKYLVRHLTKLDEAMK